MILFLVAVKSLIPVRGVLQMDSGASGGVMGEGDEKKRGKTWGDSRGRAGRKKDKKNGFTFVGVFPQYSSPRLHTDGISK